MTTYKDAHHRSVVKALSWRVVATATTMTIVFVCTHRLILFERFTVSGMVGVLGVISKLILYYIHERTWNKIGFGRQKHPLSGLSVNKPLSEENMEMIKNKLKDLGYIDED